MSAPEPPLVDDEARRSIREDLDATLFVEAGAGSGKTTELVGRIVALVASGAAELGQIVAITFTEAAAAELRVRVRERLATACADPEREEEGRERCRIALERIDEAAISTIHGFCYRLLSAYPIEAGLPPRIEVLDEVAQSLEWRERWSAELDHLAEQAGVTDILWLARVLGIRPDHLEALARRLDEEWHLAGDRAVDFSEEASAALELAASLVEELTEVLEAALDALGGCSDPDDLLAVGIESFRPLAEALASAKSTPEAVELALSTELRRLGRAGRKENWGGDATTARDLAVSARTNQEQLGAKLRTVCLRAFVDYFEGRARAAAAERARRGRLTYHDLLVGARDLLATSETARGQIRRRFTRLLIDEFQDTDPLQLEVARLLAGDGATFEAGRAFFVGDPKQSIYRFRGADVGAYLAAADEIVGGAVTSLTSNFRSAPEIIEVVNGAFAELMEPFHPLDAARESPVATTVDHPVSIVGGPNVDDISLTELRELEAEECCRAIELAVGVEQWPVDDREGGSRPARLSDVAILIPRRTAWPQLEAALSRHQIGYRIESASLIFASQEVRDLLALARALDEPGNARALVAALRSPAFSIGDDELVRFASTGGRWSVEEPVSPGPADAAPRVAAALGALAAVRERRRDLDPVGLLALAVRELRLFAVAADRPHPRESWRRMRFLLERARAFADAGGGGLAAFADWVADQLAAGMRGTESVEPEGDEEVVRIMTVHGAKGLEFPITVLCGFGSTAPATSRGPLVLRDPDGVAEVQLSAGVRTDGFAALAEEAARLDEAEERRLLYVAATRARDHLVLCGHSQMGGRRPPGLGAALVQTIDRLQLPHRVLAVDEVEPLPPREEVAAAPLVVTSRSQYDDFLARRNDLLARAARPASLRATEVAALVVGHQPAEAGPPDDAESAAGDEEGIVASGPSRRGRAGTQIGRAVHATLQTLPVADAVALGAPGAAPAATAEAASRLAATAAAQALAERVGDRAAEIERLATVALRSPVVAAAFASGTARRESYVSAPIGPVVLDGFVDLCFTEADGTLTVVDYKTDAVGDAAELEERADRYGYQAAAYAVCLEAATGRVVGRCVLVFCAAPGGGLEREYAGEELRAAKAAVRSVLEGAA